jgi:parvulin-like peptidyl-prolyl isomerase
MAAEIATAAFATPAGEWIGPIRGRDGYHLVYVLDTKAPRDIRYDPEPYTDMNENGVFDQGEPFVDENKSGNWNYGQRDVVFDDFEGERVRQWIEKLRAEASIEKRPYEYR